MELSVVRVRGQHRAVKCFCLIVFLILEVKIAEVVLHHHERWDGKGYPDGLRAEEPSVLSRILSVADAFDAMCSRRPYRDRLALDKAVRTMREASGTQFDPRVAEALLKAISEQT